MFQGFSGWHALIILVVILLLFGAPKLPALARSLGQSMKILKNEVRSDDPKNETGDDAAAGSTTSTSQAAPSNDVAGTSNSDSGTTANGGDPGSKS